MMYFAQIDKNNTVLRVIVADQAFIDSEVVGDPKAWVQTSYDTAAGVNSKGAALRKNYAGVGFSYDPKLDAFVAPQPYPSWMLDQAKGVWASPAPLPVDGKYYSWNDNTKGWAAAVTAVVAVKGA